MPSSLVTASMVRAAREVTAGRLLCSRVRGEGSGVHMRSE